ncbi:MAG: 6-pyruvoyl trahydropterin synthase family protein [Candidatus Kapaibacterium sp.]
MLYVTRTMKFSASHRLFNPEFSEEKNEDIFDKCNNYHGHGHNYQLEVTVAGRPDPETGYVIDLKKLKGIIRENVIDKVDHKHLNFDVDFLFGVIPTVENLAVIFWNILKDKISGGKLYKIKLYESDTSFVEYYGEAVDIKYFEQLREKNLNV